ncbi:MAG: hypothetical protein R2852_07900 [Bacteroidia bacterium]
MRISSVKIQYNLLPSNNAINVTVSGNSVVQNANFGISPNILNDVAVGIKLYPVAYNACCNDLVYSCINNGDSKHRNPILT